MRVRLDTEGSTTDCPLAGLGIGTREDCGDCLYFMEMDGNEVVCSCQEPIEPEGLSPSSPLSKGKYEQEQANPCSKRGEYASK